MHPPLVDGKLTGYLAPLANKGVGYENPTLSNRNCLFLAAQLEKVYHAEWVAAQSFSSVTILQVYQTELLEELGTDLATVEPYGWHTHATYSSPDPLAPGHLQVHAR